MVTECEVEATREPKKHSPVGSFLIRLVREKPLGTAGAIIVFIMLLIGVFANVIAPHGMNEINLAFRLRPPSLQYPMGTDQLGRDLLSRVIYGARTSIIVGLTASLISVTLSFLLGSLSGYFGGKFDLVAQRLVDAWMSLPGLFIILTVMSLVKPGLWQLVFVIGLSAGIRESRIIRSAVIGIINNTYFEAAQSIGSSDARIITRHIFPNVTPQLIIIFSLSVGQMILVEATVSFLGFGIPPPTPSWGSLISIEGREFMLQAPWLLLWPGLFLSLTVFGMNMLGDAVRDLLDPRLRGGLGRYTGVKKKTKN